MRRFNNILCVVEHGKEGKPALDKAVTLAEHNQAKLTVVEVISRVPAGIGLTDGGPNSRDLQTAMVREHEARLVSLIEPYRRRLDVKHGVLTGTSFLEIIRAVLRNGHDLVIKCPESPSWLDRFFSGDDMHLLRKCPCPVWLIKPEAPKTYQRILAAVDVGDSYSQKELETNHRLNVQILEMATSLAISESAELHITYAWESSSEMIEGFVMFSDVSEEKRAENIEQERRHNQWLLNEFIRNLKVKNHAVRDAMEYLQPRAHLSKGSPRKEIPALAKRLAVDCILMGTVARTGIPGFIMGNTAETILEQIECSVLAIKPEEFVTPVVLDD
jgi:nucleotide-binding universal stress UspA family protein